ncbi:MAG: Palmitoyltransferase [Peltula sp. TS41687]|nr:MAG: Palmitoyltransferase [Peltula sp. TS41687]
MPSPPNSKLFIPGVSLLIVFLAYSSQHLFLQLEPVLEPRSQVKFNLLVLCIWICYYRACFTDPGRIPKDWTAHAAARVNGEATNKDEVVARSRRWCRKCIPKMDHHCPWTANCVSHMTFPHFMRFLFYAVAAMTYLEYMLYLRGAVIWANRHLPSYLGPSATQLIHLFVLTVTNSFTLFAVAAMFARSIWSLAVNTTTIEGWEIDRHHALLRRARILGGYVYGPGGVEVPITRQEFPYDVGIWQNYWDVWKKAWLTKDGWMDALQVLSWFWPFAATVLPIENALDYPVNGFEEPSLDWPPPDPEREDKPWTNAEGERLGDFGVDEDEELYGGAEEDDDANDDDDVPLSELLRRRGEE